MADNTKQDKELDTEFYQKTLRPDRQHSYKVIAKFINRIAWPEIKSVVDYGCGAGWILHYLKYYGVTDLVGVEPNKAALSVMDEGVASCVKFRTLKRNINLNRKFDLVVCLEVGEHIEDKFSDLLIDNITKHTNRLVFSAATPGQGGWGHINEQEFEYWEDKLIVAGFRCNRKATEQFRIYLENKGAKKWYRKNISVFERE
jgi:2-polyprenyl-3-methyl-5-hydroxy-6-metoxy-1,4-benzoquinol methylase